MRFKIVPAGAVLLTIFPAARGLAQPSLNLSADTVLLNSTEARAIHVTAIKSASPLTYTVEDKPSWVNIYSSNHYTTPDTLSFQISSSRCGTCMATVRLIPAGGGEAASVMVRYNVTSTPPQTRLVLSTPTVNLSNSQARQVTVNAPAGGAVEYSATRAPDWLVMTSANHFRTPDTLYFQLASANCGDCKANIMLLLSGASTGTPLTVTYDANSGSSYRVTATHVTLAFPAAFGSTCGAGFFAGCRMAMSTTDSAVKVYNAKVLRSEDNWILMNNTAGSITNVPVANGLTLSVNPAVVNSLATGIYSGQVVVYNPANQSDVLLIPVWLLVNPGNMSISPGSGAGNSQTFTIQIPHPGGWQHLSVINMLIASTLEAQHACYAAYAPAKGSLSLLNDEGKEDPSGINSQCAVRLVSAKGDGNLLRLALNVTFAARFAGKKNIYLASRDNAQNNSDWQIAGTWEVQPPPAKTPPRKKK